MDTHKGGTKNKLFVRKLRKQVTLLRTIRKACRNSKKRKSGRNNQPEEKVGDQLGSLLVNIKVSEEFMSNRLYSPFSDPWKFAVTL